MHRRWHDCKMFKNIRQAKFDLKTQVPADESEDAVVFGCANAPTAIRMVNFIEGVPCANCYVYGYPCLACHAYEDAYPSLVGFEEMKKHILACPDTYAEFSLWEIQFNKETNVAEWLSEIRGKLRRACDWCNAQTRLCDTRESAPGWLCKRCKYYENICE